MNPLLVWDKMLSFITRAQTQQGSEIYKKQSSGRMRENKQFGATFCQCGALEPAFSDEIGV